MTLREVKNLAIKLPNALLYEASPALQLREAEGVLRKFLESENYKDQLTDAERSALHKRMRDTARAIGVLNEDAVHRGNAAQVETNESLLKEIAEALEMDYVELRRSVMSAA